MAQPAPCTDRRRLELPAEHANAATVPSPCISVCQMDPASGWCRGCLRTIDEIADWSTLDADARRAVWTRLPARFDALAPAAAAPGPRATEPP